MRLFIIFNLLVCLNYNTNAQECELIDSATSGYFRLGAPRQKFNVVKTVRSMEIDDSRIAGTDSNLTKYLSASEVDSFNRFIKTPFTGALTCTDEFNLIEEILEWQ